MQQESRAKGLSIKNVPKKERSSKQICKMKSMKLYQLPQAIKLNVFPNGESPDRSVVIYARNMNEVMCTFVVLDNSLNSIVTAVRGLNNAPNPKLLKGKNRPHVLKQNKNIKNINIVAVMLMLAPLAPFSKLIIYYYHIYNKMNFIFRGKVFLFHSFVFMRFE